MPEIEFQKKKKPEIEPGTQAVELAQGVFNCNRVVDLVAPFRFSGTQVSLPIIG